jgi:WD40 repeat protein
MASGHTDGTLQVWNSSTGKRLSCRKLYLVAVWRVMFSGDGACIVSSSIADMVSVSDSITGTVLLNLNVHCDSEPMLSVDGTRLVVSSPTSLGGTFHLLDSSTGAQCFSTTGSNATVWGNLAMFVAVCVGSTVEVWDSVANKKLAELLGHAARVSAITFSDDGTRLLSASDDRSVQVWDWLTRAQLMVLEVPREVKRVDFSEGGTWILAGILDPLFAIVWDSFTGEKLAEMQLDGYVIHLGFPDIKWYQLRAGWIIIRPL